MWQICSERAYKEEETLSGIAEGVRCTFLHSIRLLFYRMQNCKAHRLVTVEHVCGSRVWEHKISRGVSTSTLASMAHALKLCCVIWKSESSNGRWDLLSRCAHLSSTPTKSFPFYSEEIALRLDGHSSRNNVANAHAHTQQNKLRYVRIRWISNNSNGAPASIL